MTIAKSQKIRTHLWFDKEAEEAAALYVSLFKNSKVTHVSRWGEGGPVAKGTAMTVNFVLDGQEMIGLNAGPVFKFNEAVSLFVTCEDQAEVDHFWNGLTAHGGSPSQCGWLKDKFGLSWQIIPKQLMELMSGGDAARSGRVMQAMLKMSKIDIALLQAAYEGR